MATSEIMDRFCEAMVETDPEKTKFTLSFLLRVVKTEWTEETTISDEDWLKIPIEARYAVLGSGLLFLDANIERI